MYMLSVVIPAHNEEAFIGACIASVKKAAEKVAQPVEIIVCINRCSDNTEAIAKSLGAIVVEETEANVAKVRNRGMAAATGDIIVTLDADSTLSENYLKEVERLMQSGLYMGGAGLMITDKLNLASVILGIILVFPALMLMRFSGGMFWMSRAAYLTTGGFDENFLTGEDFDFWRKMRQLARFEHKRFGMVSRAYIRTSARKMDEFGPWFMLTHPHWFYYAIKGNNRDFADRYLYKTTRSNKPLSHADKNKPGD
jgi:glycosyltransferase involved in cell wall biosynthesis